MTEDKYADSPLADLYTADKAVATLTKNLLQSSAVYILAEVALLGWFYYASLQRKIAILEQLDMTMGDDMMAGLLQIPVMLFAFCHGIGLLWAAGRDVIAHGNLRQLLPALLFGLGLIALLSWLTIFAWKTAMHL